MNAYCNLYLKLEAMKIKKVSCPECNSNSFNVVERISMIEELGETEYEKYPENMNKLVLGINELPDSQWTKNQIS